MQAHNVPVAVACRSVVMAVDAEYITRGLQDRKVPQHQGGPNNKTEKYPSTKVGPITRQKSTPAPRWAQ